MCLHSLSISKAFTAAYTAFSASASVALATLQITSSVAIEYGKNKKNEREK